MAYADTILGTTGVVGYWRFGEPSGTVANDEVGVNDGTIDTGVALGATGALTGDANTAADFDGGAAGSISFADPNLVVPFSLEAWAFCEGPGSVGSTNLSCIFGYSAVTRRLLIRNELGFRNVLAQMGGTDLTTPVNSAPLNTWLHIVYTADGTNAKIYINGAEAATQANAATTFTLPFLVGAYIDPSVNYSFLGQIDEVAIYSVALSPSTVLNHYQVGTDTVPPPGTGTNNMMLLGVG